MSKTQVGIPQGGTGASTAAAALTALGAYPAANPSGFVTAAATVANASAVGGYAASTVNQGNTVVARDGAGNIAVTSFAGAGTGLTGTAAGLSIGGNATTATYATNSSKLFALDPGYAYGSANPYYGGLTYNAATSRWRFQVTPGTPAGVEVAYADLSLKASTLAQGGGNGPAMQFNWTGQPGTPNWLWGGSDGLNHFVYSPGTMTVLNSTQLSGISSNRVMMKRRSRINTTDGTSLNSSITAPEMGFSYGGSGEPAGPFMAFGGLGGDIDYSCQIAAAYSSGGNDIKIRTNNSDGSGWNPWRTVWTDGNLPTPEEGPVVSSLVKRTVNGYIRGSYINMTDDSAGGAGTTGGAAVTAIMGKSGDDYYRGQGAGKIKTFLAITGADIASSPNFSGTVGAGRVQAPTSNNLHLDPAAGGYSNYFNYFNGTGGSYFCNGATAIVASISNSGVISGAQFTGSGSGLTGEGASFTAGASNRLNSRGNYVWSAAMLPSAFNLGQELSFVQAANGFPSYGSLITTKGYTGGGGSMQMLVPYGPSQGGTQLKVRFGNYDVNGGDSWTGWKSIWDSESLVNVSQLVNNNGYIASGSTVETLYSNGWWRSNGVTGWYNQTYGGGIFMQDTTYVRTYGGKDFYCDANITAGGNITAYSDERLKTNWRDAPADFVEQWAGVKNGTYDRVDNALTQVGVSAQNVQAILPAAVTEVEGLLSLNYGGATAVATVKLAERAVENTVDIQTLFKLVAELQARIKELEAK